MDTARSKFSQIDFSICAALFALGGLILWGAKDIPPPFFDPLGSAALPKVCAYLIIAFSLVIAARAFLRLKSETKVASSDDDFKPEPWLAVAVVLLASLYTLSMNLGWLGFRSGTVLFIFSLGAVLSRFDKTTMIVSGGLALLFGLGGQYIFTEFFYIDLPK